MLKMASIEMQDSNDSLTAAISSNHTEMTKTTVVKPGTTLGALKAEYGGPS